MTYLSPSVTFGLHVSTAELRKEMREEKGSLIRDSDWGLVPTLHDG